MTITATPIVPRRAAAAHVPFRPLAAQPWQARAECRNVDPELMFPGRGESTRAAKAVCAICAVRTECLAYALDAGERFGVWGGTSERERRKMRNPRLVGAS